MAAEWVRYPVREGQVIIAALEVTPPLGPAAGVPAAVLPEREPAPPGGAVKRLASAVPAARRPNPLAQAMQVALEAPRGGRPAVPPAEPARTGAATSAAVPEVRPAVLPGYVVRIVDGNHWAATAHRLKALRS